MFFKKLKNEENYLEFKNIINDIRLHEKVKEMNNYMQHSSTSCYNHCLHVAYYTYLVCKKFKLDYFSATRAAMLHDFFLYDWHEHRKVNSFKELHAFSHPKIALENSLKNFTLNDLEKDVIVKHMWPLTIKLPKYKESYIVTFVDKYCATVEFFKYLNKKYKLRMVYRYAYIFLTILFVRF